MKRALVAIALVIAGCSSPTPPPAQSAPESQPPSSTTSENAIGTVKVTTKTLNVRKDASASSDVVGQVKKNDRLALLQTGVEWMRVRLADGTIGWVSAGLVTREGATSSRSRRGCAADSDYRFAKAPTPSFSDSGAHGVVTVDANVDRNGNVTSTKIIANTTGDKALAALAEREIRGARFVAPIRDCAQQAFIFTYKRTF